MAYAVGLLATDGCLSGDGRHLELTSKDREQLENFRICVGIKNKITTKISGYTGKSYTRIQFSDVTLYRFLTRIGLTPAKSKTIGKLIIPRRYFFDFLRGAFDGDGSFYSYMDPRWKSSYMFYTAFTSASMEHIQWLRASMSQYLGIKGHITNDGRGITHQLKYAKRESLKILGKMYRKDTSMFLTRKRLKIDKALHIIGMKL